MNNINNNSQNWNNILKEFKLHLIPTLNPEGYLISSYAIRKIIPREMNQDEAYPQNLLIELSAMGSNPIAPYGDIQGNYTNVINSNLDAVKYTLDVASIAQKISEATYQVIKKHEPDINYETLTSVQDLIYKEFSKKIKTLQNMEKEENEEYDR